MERYVCVHGHFYQPPRENPWLEAIEQQDSAYPYHDWNERVSAECYEPNAASRILDDRGRIVEIVNNYSRISFNFGPTLLAWLEEEVPGTYAAVIQADRESRDLFSGHGSALAQPYNHMILPLSNPRDRRTQVVWGIRDFEHRFGRSPEGMWLPETAVDVPTLELLAELGIRFTILAPHQAARVRPLAGGPWQDVTGARIDPTRPYVQRLPSGREIALFFYDGPIARAVAFEGLLRDGSRFADRLLSGFDGAQGPAQLVHIATDGETYGHHHRHGDMALAFALREVENSGVARLTNYAEYLERHPPQHEVEILEETSWSCAHGIERWRSDCGCETGGRPEWNQAWREPLRAALDWLRETLAPAYEERAAALLRSPWEAREAYIDVVLDRSPEVQDGFLDEHAAAPLSEEDRRTALKLLELQRQAMLMYTSCGWFFNEVSGIETVQVMRYAGRAIQLAREVLRLDLEPPFLDRLERARSNLPERRDARRIYEDSVQPAMVDLSKVGGHYAVSSLFEPYSRESRVYCYRVLLEKWELLESGSTRLATGRARITSEVTRDTALLSFGVLHLGDHNLSGGVRSFAGEEAYAALKEEVSSAFARADIPAVIRVLDRHFQGSTYSLRSLFRDEQRRIIGRILQSTLREAEAVYRGLYESHAPLMRFLADLDMPLPRPFEMAAQLVLNSSLVQTFEETELDLDRARALLEEARASEVPLDEEGLGYALERTLEDLARRAHDSPRDAALLRKLDEVAGFATALPFEVNLWEVQNRFYDLLRNEYPAERRRAEQGEAEAREWVERFSALGAKLAVAVP